ncbi:MAG: hypothetical protein KatS3mg124_0750 [Porticoccaceae bacterium]|nr:MAG: hypothetical protein KatS3mg124_0750 [Porticoccaceae bacterium]
MNTIGQPGSAARGRLLSLAAALAILAAIAYWLLAPSPEPPPPPAAAAPPPAATPPPLPESVREAPDIPPPPPGEGAEEAEAQHEAPPLPPLAESDPWARELLAPLVADSPLAPALSGEGILQRAAAAVEVLARGGISYKALPLKPPREPFRVRREEDRLYLDPANYARYEPLVDALTALPPEAVAGAFHRLRPLFEEAFAELGQPAEVADNALVAAIDQLLAAPEVEEPVTLVRETVTYQFADPALEALPPAQKFMIRIGPDNRRRLARWLGEVRAALLAGND